MVQRKIFITVVGTLCCTLQGFSQLPSAAIVAVADNTWLTDVELKLEATGYFSFVDVIDGAASTPSVANLQTYDAVLVFTDSPGFLDPVAFGNNLSTYADGGGGVVVSVFALVSGLEVQGNFSTNYNLITPSSQTSGTVPVVMNVLETTHPLFFSDPVFNGGTASYRAVVSGLASGSVTAAEWADGQPLVVYKENMGPANVRRVDLNLFPPSSDARSDFWDATTDGDVLMANALAWVAGYDLCGGGGGQSTLTTSTGSIADGSNQFDYLNNYSCSWLIQPPGATSIDLTFTAFNTESGFDEVTVYNANFADPGAILGTFSGDLTASLPPVQTASSGSMFVEFSTDGIVTFPGWSANYTATVSAQPIAAPDFGTSLNFDGIDDYADLSAVPLTPDFTFETWVKWNGGATFQRIFDFGDDTNIYMFLTPDGVGSGPRFAITNTGGGGEQILQSSGVLLDIGAWNHLALTVDSGIGTWTMYINGTVVASASGYSIDPGFIGAVTNYWLGRSLYVADPYFNGNLDEIRFWSVARTQAEIQENMARSLIGNEFDLVGYYRLDEGQPGVDNTGVTPILDSSPSGATGTLPGFSLIGGVSNYDNTFLTNIGSFQNSNYYRFDGSWTWEESNIAANSSGGHLVSITDASEQAFLPGIVTEPYWIGLSQNLSSPAYSEPAGGWEWSSGEANSYTNWNAGEPNDAGGENYAHMSTGDAWNDIGGSAKYMAVFEFSPFVSPAFLAASFPFSGNAVDATGNGNDGTVFGATLTTDRDGSANSAYSFDGSSYITSPQIFSGGQDFSASVWVQYTGPNGLFQNILSWKDGNAYLDVDPSGFIRFGDPWVNTGVTLPSNQWVHVAVTHNASILQSKVYLNGLEMASSTTGGYSFSNLYIGKQGPSINELWTGQIDDIKLFNKTLSATEVQALANEAGVLPAPTFTFALSSETININSGDNLVVNNNLIASAAGDVSIKTRAYIGSQISFAKADFADWTLPVNQDQATDMVWLTRADSMGLFNINQEASYNSSSPALTLWSPQPSVLTSSYTQTWGQSHGFTPPDMVGNTYSFITTEAMPRQFDVDWLSWTSSSSGGGFSYDRIEVPTYVDITNPDLTINGDTNIPVTIDAAGLAAGSYQFDLVVDYGTGTTTKTLFVEVAPAGSLIAHWPVTSALGGSDVSGNGFDLLDEGSGLGASALDRFKITDDAFSFDGTSNYGRAAATSHPTGNFNATYSFWEYHSVDHTGKFISVGQNLQTDASAVRVSSNAYQYQNGQDVVTFSPISKLNRWNHVVLIRQGDDVTLWLNGVEYETVTMAISQGLATTDIYVGQTGGGGEFFQGRMDDIRIYDYAISSTEILDLFNENVDTSIPIAWLSPSIADGDDQVTVFYNAERGNKEMMGADDVYIHAGGVVGEDPLAYDWGGNGVISAFNDPDPIAQMTQVPGEANQWQITLSPDVRTALNAPVSGTIQRIGMIFRDPNGTIAGTGTPSEYGDFTGGRVEDGTYWTPGDIYLDLFNLTGLAADSLALVQLYQSTNGAGWFDNSNWLTGPVDTWYGVTVSNGRVTELDLYDNNLVGSIPGSIGQLTAAVNLYLSLNDFSGSSLPAEMNDLVSLVELGLFSTGLTGDIPDMSALTNLTFFSLSDNDFTGPVPTWLGNLTGLTDVYLWGNNLTGTIPTELGNLTNMDWLNLSNNNLTGGIPSSLGNLTVMTYLSLGNNQLSGPIPVTFGNLTSLDVLALGGNDLSGTIPSFIGNNLLSLTQLYLWGNDFTGSIPSNIGNLSAVTELWLSSNLLTGSIPPELNNLSSVVTMVLGTNQLTGTIPDLSNLQTNLSVFSVFENSLSGDVPGYFNQFTNLTIFSVRDNDFDNMVDLTGLTLVTDIRAEGNKFTFEDILPNIGVASNGYTYDPQQNVGDEQFIQINQGSSYTIDLAIDQSVVGNNYDWYLDGSFNQSTSTPLLTISNFQVNQTWHAEITNTSAPDLTLITSNINLEISNLCVSAADDPADTRIDRVVFGDLDNTSSVGGDGNCSTYSNFTNLSATVGIGQVVDVGFQIGTCGGLFDRGIKMYVDWDKDGSFDEGTELVGEGGILTDADPDEFFFFSEDFYTIPSVPLGNYTLRVTAQETSDLATITGCNTYAFGETEDYTIRVIDALSDLVVSVDDVLPLSMFNFNTPISTNDQITISVSVTNIGDYQSTMTNNGVGFYQSSDQVWDTGDVLLDMQPLNPVDPASSITLSDIMFSPPTIDGSFYLIAAVNPTDDIAESDIGNNSVVSNLIFVELGDTSDPVISITTSAGSYELGTGGVDLTATISDPDPSSGLAEVKLFHAKAGSTTFTEIIPEETAANSGLYSYRAGDNDFDQVGLQYYFMAVDNGGNQTTTSTRTIPVFYAQGALRLSSPRPVANDDSPDEGGADYRIFSVPTRDGTVGSVVGPGPFNNESLRLFQYGSSGNSPVGTSSGTTLSAGKGYWIIYRSDANVDFDFGGTAVISTANAPFSIQLQPGINLIGNPYNFSISWVDVLAYNVVAGNFGTTDVSSSITKFEGFFQGGTTSLGVTEGGFINNNAGNATLAFPISAGPNRISTNTRYGTASIDGENWKVALDLESEFIRYNVASFGFHPEATEGLDNLDQPAMPYLGKFLELVSTREQFTTRMSEDIVAPASSQVWEFEALTSYSPSKARISWDNSYFGDNDIQLFLYDTEQEKIVDMRELSVYNFYLSESRRFRVYYGSEAFIQQELNPNSVTLGQAYPNPFNNNSTIPFTLPGEKRIYNVGLYVYNSLGERVRVLQEGQVQSGFYKAAWDGKNDSGQYLSEGIYIYQMVVDQGDGPRILTGKIIYRN